MKYNIKVFSIWEFGQRKDAQGNPHQEDCTYPLPKDLNDSDRTFILCDGMGGHDAGEVASATVCETMGASIAGDGHDSEGVFTDQDLQNAIAAAFDALDKKDSGAEKKMGTTMTFLKLHNEGATIAHMGDSRVYHIRPGKDGADTKILFRTEDHSLVNDLVRIGELTEEEARRSSQKNVITRAMQPNMERRPKADIHHITDIQSGDYFYMCSDGMLEATDMANGESLRNIFSRRIATPEEKVKMFKTVTSDNRDNHTALIILVENVTGAEKAAGVTSATVKETVGEPKKGKEPVAESGKKKPGFSKSGFFIIALMVIAALLMMQWIKTSDSPDTLDADKTGNIENVTSKPNVGSKKIGKPEKRQKATPESDVAKEGPSTQETAPTSQGVPASAEDGQSANSQPATPNGSSNPEPSETDPSVVNSHQQTINNLLNN